MSMTVDANKVMRQLLVRAGTSLRTIMGDRVYFLAAPPNSDKATTRLIFECKESRPHFEIVTEGICDLEVCVPSRGNGTYSAFQYANDAIRAINESISVTNVLLPAGFVISCKQEGNPSFEEIPEIEAVCAAVSYRFQIRPI